jgi:RNA polymerase sigma-70 factor (ECF subfamily)
VSFPALAFQSRALRLVQPERPSSDAPLVAAAQGGDRAAMKELYLRHGSYIAGLCARLMRSRDEAREITQDCFVTAIEQIGQLRDGDAFRAWVARIAVRQVNEHLKKQRLWRLIGVRGEEDATLFLLSEGAPTEARAELRLLDGLLLKLPPEQRVAWMLRHIEDESLDDVARICDCSLATVKRWIDAADTLIQRELRQGDA